MSHLLCGMLKNTCHANHLKIKFYFKIFTRFVSITVFLVVVAFSHLCFVILLFLYTHFHFILFHSFALHLHNSILIFSNIKYENREKQHNIHPSMTSRRGCSTRLLSKTEKRVAATLGRQGMYSFILCFVLSSVSFILLSFVPDELREWQIFYFYIFFHKF